MMVSGLLLALSLGVSRELPAASRVKLATWAPKGSSYHQIVLSMGEKWRQAPGGGVQLNVYPDGTMGSEADIVRKMRVGQLQGGLLTVVGLSEIEDSVNALQTLPMMFRSLDEVEHVRAALRPGLEKKLSEKGFVMLAWADLGWVRFFSKDEAVRPSDLKELKLFVTAGDVGQLDIMKAMGYQPVPLEWSDILPSLQTGLINAAFLHPFFALTSQTYSTAPHMLELNFAPLVGGVVVTQKAWDALGAEAQAVLRATGAEAGAELTARGRVENEESVAAMKKRGLIVHPVTPDLEAEWRGVAEAVYPQIRGRLVPAETFDEVQKLLREFRGSAGQP
jgi:TRAP-type C4-dicarboxylate transport system substrate-binding protein